MIRGGFLSVEDRNKLIALARDGSAASRVTRRANALVLLDDGWSCQEVADALLLNDDTIRGWHKLFERRARRCIEGVCRHDAAAHDAPGRCLDRAGIRPRLRKPFGIDRAVASPGARISQAECHSAQAQRREAEGFHREL